LQRIEGLNRGVKRPAQQNFNNNGVSVVKRSRGGRGPGGRGPRKDTPKKDAKNECVVLDDTEKKAQEGFCKICQEKFDGTYNQHKLTKPHREKRAQKYPSCGPCGLKFNGDDARQRYEVHLGSKGHVQMVESAELEIKEGQEPEGTELCEDVEAVQCSLCECVFKKELIETHCKTKGHLKRITKKKAEAERAAKKAEEEAKKAAGGDAEEGTGENGNTDENGGGDHDDEDDDNQDDEEDVQDAGDDAAPADAEAVPAEEEAPVDAPESEAPIVEEPAPEPAKASPVKRAGRGRGRGRGRK